jgi:hypothetical protein
MCRQHWVKYNITACRFLPSKPISTAAAFRGSIDNPQRKSYTRQGTELRKQTKSTKKEKQKKKKQRAKKDKK